MGNKKLYAEFELLAEKLDLKIIKDKGNFIGGVCIIKDEKVIVVNKMKPLEQRLRVLANSFLSYNLDDNAETISFVDQRLI